ncbi:hypothetical protein HDV00_008419 [Rhizophlyctis rosea]|nr:hypothetical protein HDV00_008419 [Rhizophlyctis rosea]
MVVVAAAAVGTMIALTTMGMKVDVVGALMEVVEDPTEVELTTVAVEEAVTEGPSGLLTVTTIGTAVATVEEAMTEEDMTGATVEVEVVTMEVVEAATANTVGPHRQGGATKSSGTEEERNRSKCLYVGNLPYAFSDNDVKDLFNRCGRLDNVKVPFDRYTGRNKGFAFVTFEERRDAEDAKDKYDGFTIEGRRLKLDWDVGQEKKDEIKGIDRRPSTHGDNPAPPPNDYVKSERARSPGGGGGRMSPRYEPYRQSSPGPYASRR